MKKAKKILTLVLSACLLVAISIGATVAYLTSTPDPVVNTFTVGKVEITLDEAEVDEYGDVNLDAEDRVTANEYKLIPGHEYIKDPTIHVGEDSENCWVFVKVENGLADIEATDNSIAVQIKAKGWTELDGVEGVYYKDNVAAKANLVVFEKFTLADNADVSAYADAEITITGFAVQYDGVTSVTDAWDAVKPAA